MFLADFFEKELSYISNNHLRNVVKEVLNNSPKCIATIPASSSGKYHPKLDLTVGRIDKDGTIHAGGLVYHTKTVVAICLDLIRNMYFDKCISAKTEEERQMWIDSAIASCICHDCCKASDDDENHTTIFEHSLLASELFSKTLEKYIVNNKSDLTHKEYGLLKGVYKPIITSAISSHMGKWNTSKYSDIVLPTPETDFELFIHLCDYIASRKILDFNLDFYNSN